MKKAIFNALNIKEEEANKVILLVLQSAFLGSFYGTFDIGAHTLFLKTFAEEMIPKAYTLSGIVGIILTAIYSKLQSKIPFSKLAIINLLTISIITALLRLGFELTGATWLVFLIFMMMGPLNIVGLVGFWGTASRLFTLREGKRLFGIIDAGQIIGIIIASYAIPIVPILLNFEPETKNLLLLSSFSILAALLFQILLSRKYNLNSIESNTSEQKERSASFKEIFKNKYLRYLALFVIFSMLVAFFVQFSFLIVTNEKYPEEADLAKYLGTFTGSMMIFTLLIKTSVYSKFMKTYGLKVSLILSPILLVFFTVIAALVGSFFGYTFVSANFILFFLIISLSKLFNKAMKDAIEVPSFKILYQSLDSSIRFDVQSKIDGTINEFSALFSGIILTLLGLISFFTLIYYTYFLVFILIGWTYISFHLYVNYRKSLEVSLDQSKSEEKKDKLLAGNISYLIKREIKDTNNKSYNKVLYLARLIEPGLYYSLLYKLLESSSLPIRKFAITQINKRKIIGDLSYLQKELKNEKNEELKKMVSNVHNTLSNELKKHSTSEQIINLSNSRDPNDRILCAQLIGALKQTELVQQLTILLRDLDPEIRKAALLAAGKIKHPEIIPAVVDNLSSPMFQRYAAAAIEEFEELAVHQLEQAFYKTGLTDDVLVLIVRLLGNIKGEEASKYLFAKISHNNHEVAYQALVSTRMCNFIPNENELHNIQQFIEEIISIIGWNMTAIYSLKEDETTNDLRKALIEENNESNEILFHLLAIAYNSQSIQLVREYMDSGTSEGIGYAIELLDLFVADELKPILFPLFEDTTVLEKIKILQNHFPIEIMNDVELINSIINRDPNYMSRWTKVCAIKLIPTIENYEITNDILAHLFNSDKLIRETAGIIIKELDENTFIHTSKRMNKEKKQQIEEAFEYKDDDKYKLLYSKNIFLKNLTQFENISGRILTKLGDYLEYKVIEPTENLLETYNEENLEYFFLIKGSLQIFNNGTNKKIAENSFINEMHTILPISEIKIKITEKSYLYSIPKDIFEAIVFNNPEIAKAIINNSDEEIVDSQIEKELIEA
ncbi:MAG: hypothetical protein GXO79_07210 [Chlorobi bacterium]|nr:hypothetical protein [Chlorobiota bacterium]